jgi:NADH:ubiquinone oxidoreductase subunit 6 (subunit J)
MLLIISSSAAFISAVLSMASFSVHSAVYLMLITFTFSSTLYFIVSSTYVSMTLLIIYVNAVSILFIFLVNLLNFRTNIPNQKVRFFFFPLMFLFFLSFVVFTYFSFFDFNSVLGVTTSWSSFEYLTYTKNHAFVSTFFTIFSQYVIVIGLLLFFVTVVVTALFS